MAVDTGFTDVPAGAEYARAVAWCQENGLMAGVGGCEKEAFATARTIHNRELLKNMSPADLTDEVRDTPTELRNRGYKLSIGSSSKNTKFILGQIGLGDFFDAIADGTDITHSKPDPEVFLISVKKIGITPRRLRRGGGRQG